MSIAKQLNDKSKFKNLVVLIVDDSKTSAVLIRQQISAFGTPYGNIDVSYSYQDAIKHVEQRFYDVLILDYHLEQCINGNELATLLNKRKLISHQTGIILVSGDTRQETVLTVLSGEIQHFIKKPVQIHALGIKVLSVCEDKKAVNLGQALIEGCTLNHIDKKLRLIALIEKSPSPIIVESAIFDSAVLNQQWALLSSLLTTSSTALHMSKACAFGQLSWHKGNTEEAISYLEAFLIAHPLAHQVMDKLAEIFIENKQHKHALNVAFRSFECTPSINKRMLTAARLSTQQGDIAKLIVIGKTFANNFSIIDVSWLNAIVDYCECVLEIMRDAKACSQYNELLRAMKVFFSIANKRLTAHQKVYLASYMQLFSSQVNFLRDSKEVAHRSLFKAVSPHYQDLNKLPLILKLNIIRLADKFGEFWLSETLLKISILKNDFEKNTELELMVLASDTQRCKEVGALNNKLSDIRDVFNIDDTRLLSECKKMLKNYPYSIEVQLVFFKASILCNADKNSNNLRIYQLQDENLLPPNWCAWLKNIEREGVSIPLPLAF